MQLLSGAVVDLAQLHAQLPDTMVARGRDRDAVATSFTATTAVMSFAATISSRRRGEW